MIYKFDMNKILLFRIVKSVKKALFLQDARVESFSGQTAKWALDNVKQLFKQLVMHPMFSIGSLLTLNWLKRYE